MIGSTLGRCRITDKLGQGGMGEVYHAEDTNLSRQVAIKVLPDELADDASAHRGAGQALEMLWIMLCSWVRDSPFSRTAFGLKRKVLVPDFIVSWSFDTAYENSEHFRTKPSFCFSGFQERVPWEILRIPVQLPST